MNNLQEYQKQIKELREYLISEFKRNFKLEHLLATYHKEGLYTVLSYFFQSSQFGSYIAEKLDINDISAGKIIYPYNEQERNGEYLRFSFGKKNSSKDVNYLVKAIKNLILSNHKNTVNKKIFY